MAESNANINQDMRINSASLATSDFPLADAANGCQLVSNIRSELESEGAMLI
jgi:hypothetical protein